MLIKLGYSRKPLENGAMMFVVGGTMGENWKELSIDNDERCKLSPRALGKFRFP